VIVMCVMCALAAPFVVGAVGLRALREVWR